MAVKSICGVILTSEDPAALASFYGEALGIRFEQEDHGDLATHFGVDIGRIHFGIHPPANLRLTSRGHARTTLAFDVESLSECQARLAALGAPCVQEPHDEGFGLVASYRDPEGNQFEIVELRYDFPASS
jgi:predicted enzyme related to lactoylglutathione lyase